MYKIFQFLYRIRIFLFFIFLELFNAIQIFNRNNYQKAIFFNASNEWISSWVDRINSIEDYIHLGDQNQKLVEENAKLKEILFNNIDISEAEMDSIILTNNLINQIDYIIMPARVVYNSVNLSKNYLTINKGKLDGVETGMGVISSSGIVGKVIKTIDHHSLVMSVLNTENSISAKIKSNQELGYIKWDGSLSEIIDLNDISKFKRVELGDSIVTSDYNTVYPSDILIGVVAEIGLKEDGNFHEIKVLLSNEFQKLKNVYLVKNKNKKEIDSIIEEINSLKEDE